MKKLLCILLMLLAFCACGDPAASETSSAKSLARPAGGTMTGAVQPVMLVHGEPYYWDGMATVIPNGLGGNVYVGNQTGLPEGYIQQGELGLFGWRSPRRTCR